MTIDFYKLIQIITPPALRRTKLLELFRILIAKPMQNLHTDLVLWREVIRYKAALTPQTIALETMAKKLLDTTIEITELDGKPFDFLVQVTGTPDLNKLTRLLNTYKLAGKSFTYVLSGATYVCEFVEHVAEEVNEVYVSEFIQHVAEDDGIVNIRVSLLYKNSDNESYWVVRAKADRAVKSAITIYAMIYQNGSLIDRCNVLIEVNTKEGEFGRLYHNGDAMIYIGGGSITPESDDWYNYKLIY